MKKKIVVMMLVIGVTAAIAQAGAVHYIYNETAPGNWEVSVVVTGADTSGLSSYSVWVVDVTAGTCSWAQNVLSVANSLPSPPYFESIGFAAASSSDTVYPGTSTPSFNAGSLQQYDTAIPDIGLDDVDVTGTLAGHVVLGVPALIGTLTTPTGLYDPEGSHFSSFSAGLLNLAGDGYLPDVDVTYEVTPEPATMAVLLAGLALVLVARRRR